MATVNDLLAYLTSASKTPSSSTSSPLSLALSSIYQANQQRLGIPTLNPLLLALAQQQPASTKTAAAAAPSTAAAAAPTGTPIAPGIGSTVGGDLYGTNLVQQIIQDAKKVGLDPNVPLSIAPHEGGFQGAVGDNNSSFGPLQDHAGGALPAEVWAKGPAYAKQWANSPQGILYAITGLARAIHGASGAAGVIAGVRDYERPQSPTPEIQKSLATYSTHPAAAYL